MPWPLSLCIDLFQCFLAHLAPPIQTRVTADGNRERHRVIKTLEIIKARLQPISKDWVPPARRRAPPAYLLWKQSPSAWIKTRMFRGAVAAPGLGKRNRRDDPHSRATDNEAKGGERVKGPSP